MDKFEAQLRAILATDGVLTEAEDRAPYESGWRYGRGTARAIARPRTPEEVAAVLALCSAHDVRVQVQGGNTGLVGASNPDASGEQLLLSTERLRPELVVDEHARTVVVGAGETLSELNAALSEHGLQFPIDLGADPQIGGMVATNTGGTRLLRCGAVRRHVLGLEVALADGSLWTSLDALYKDNRGLDAKQLFIGTSGSFGVVTRATLALSPLPAQRATAWVALASSSAALHLLRFLEREAGELLSAFEVLSEAAFRSTTRRGANLRAPFPESCSFQRAALLEFSTCLRGERLCLEDLLLDVLEGFATAHEDRVAEICPQPPSDAWDLRHQVSECIRDEGPLVALDISVPRSAIAEFSDSICGEIEDRFAGARVFDFGHWGDGGSHINVAFPSEEARGAQRIEVQELVYGRALALGGSFSAEHGIGPHNAEFYARFGDPFVQELCHTLRETLDPRRRLGTVRLEAGEGRADSVIES